MSKGMIAGLLLLALLVVVAVNTPGTVKLELFSLSWQLRTVYALLGSAALGMVIGVLLRK